MLSWAPLLTSCMHVCVSVCAVAAAGARPPPRVPAAAAAIAPPSCAAAVALPLLGSCSWRAPPHLTCRRHSARQLPRPGQPVAMHPAVQPVQDRLIGCTGQEQVQPNYSQQHDCDRTCVWEAGLICRSSCFTCSAVRFKRSTAEHTSNDTNNNQGGRAQSAPSTSRCAQHQQPAQAVDLTVAACVREQAQRLNLCLNACHRGV